MSQSASRFDKKRALMFVAILTVVYVVLFLLTAGTRDYEITLAINTWAATTSPEFIAAVKIYTLYSYYIVGGVIYLLVILSLKVEKLKPYRAFLMGYATGLGLALIVSSLLKLVVMRPRPATPPSVFQTFGLDVPPDSSFPSVHASAGFALATPPAWRFKNWILRVLLVAYAVSLCLTRPFFGLHYVTDILAGSLVGIVASLPIVIWFEKLGAKGAITDGVLKKFILYATIAAGIVVSLSIWANF